MLTVCEARIAALERPVGRQALEIGFPKGVLRMPRTRTQGRGKSFVTSEIMISERPDAAADRAVPGYWEGDLILGLNRSAIGTLVERTTRFTTLLHLPPMPGHGARPRVKNCPPMLRPSLSLTCREQRRGPGMTRRQLRVVRVSP